MKIRNAILSTVLASSLCGCGVADPNANGLSYTKAVETDVERASGVRPEVGFNRRNGSIQKVTVTFPRVYSGKPLDELVGRHGARGRRERFQADAGHDCAGLFIGQVADRP
jgi:hypothetical protein